MKQIREKAVKYLVNLVIILMGFLLTGELAVKISFTEEPFAYETVWEYKGDAE